MKKRATARKHKAPTSMGSRVARVAYVVSPIGQVESLIGAMANPESGIKFVLGIAKKAGQRISEVQSVLFDRVKWTADAAKDWLHEHGFTSSGKDEGATFWRFRQNDPKRYKEFRTVVPGTHANPADTYRSDAYRAGRAALKYGASQHGTVNLTPSITDKVEWGHAWGDFMRGWRDEQRVKENPTENPTHTITGPHGTMVRIWEQGGGYGEGAPTYYSTFWVNNGETAANLRASHSTLKGATRWANRVIQEHVSRGSYANPTPGKAHQIGSRVSFHDSQKGVTSSGVVVSIGRSSKHPWKVLHVRTDDGQEVEVHPDRVLNPTPAESILAYDEHLATTMDPAFQAASPAEQAAAMTVQDATENPNWMEGWAAGKRVEKKQANPGIDERVIAYDSKGRAVEVHLITGHSASSYGIPVAVIRGRAYGPGDQPFGKPLYVEVPSPAMHPGGTISSDPDQTAPRAKTLHQKLVRQVGPHTDSSVNKWNAQVGRGRSNPESAAADLYEEFHGQPPAETLEIVTEKAEHEWLTQLGQLVELKVQTVTNLDATFRFGKEAPELCTSEDGKQLYIEGGDQQIDLKALKMDGEKWVKDSMTIGVLYELTYRTKKGFHKFRTTDYFHKLGEESGVQPYLLYDPRNQLLSISGGQYRTKPEGIVN